MLCLYKKEVYQQIQENSVIEDIIQETSVKYKYHCVQKDSSQEDSVHTDSVHNDSVQEDTLQEHNVNEDS